MVFPLGACINAAGVILGAGIGMFLGNRLSASIRASVFYALGLSVLVIGMQMALQAGKPLFMIGSLIIGVVIGELLCIEDHLNNGGDKLKRALRSNNNRFTDGFVASSLIYCVGSMAIIGSINEGLMGDMNLVLTKTMLDFFVSIALGSAYGSGVLLASLPVLIYQGALTIFAGSLRPILTEPTQKELTGVGGILIIGIGINLLELQKLRLSNFLPALVIIVLLCWIHETFFPL